MLFHQAGAHLDAPDRDGVLQDRGPGQEPPRAREIRARNSDSTYSLTNTSPPPKDAALPNEPAWPDGQRRQVQPGRPPLGPAVQLSQVLLAQRYLGCAQQPGRFAPGKRQIRRADSVRAVKKGGALWAVRITAVRMRPCRTSSRTLDYQ